MPHVDNENINEYDENGRTPLMNAAIAGDYDEVKRLLELGADPNIADKDWGTTKAENYAGREAKNSEVHRKIEELLVESNPHSEKKELNASQNETSHLYSSNSYSSSISLSGWLYILGFISLILAPFTGITVVTAAAFFVIAWILDH